MLLFLTMLVTWMFKVRRYRFLHETGVSMIFGLVAGLIMQVTEEKDRDLHPAVCNSSARAEASAALANMDFVNDIETQSVFDPELFFFVLLPPIIFNAGYQLKRRHFFRNIGSILTLAFIGTTVSCFVTGGMAYAYSELIASTPLTLNDCMLFGALISATDPVTILAIFHDLHVDVDLYALVFGESVLNDAVAIVLYRTIGEYNGETGNVLGVGEFFYSIWVFVLIFFGSFACGTIVAMACAAFFKFSNVKEYPIIETTLFVLASYSSFLLGEGFGLTGIVSVLFCGISQAHYTYPNLSEESRQRTRQLFELLNHMAENFVFSYIGLNVFTFQCHRWDGGFIAWSILAILIARVVHVFPLSFLSNRLRSKGTTSIPKEHQYMLVWSGLRGAIAFALAMRNTQSEAHQTILSTTLVIVLVTVMLFGGSTVAVLQKLKIKVQVSEDEEPRGTRKPEKGVVASRWINLDRLFIKPVLGVTSDNAGTANWQEVRTTMRNWWRGVKETFPSPTGMLDDLGRSSGSESETESSEILLDAVEDVFSGDLGGSGFADWASERPSLSNTLDQTTTSTSSAASAGPNNNNTDGGGSRGFGEEAVGDASVTTTAAATTTTTDVASDPFGGDPFGDPFGASSA